MEDASVRAVWLAALLVIGGCGGRGGDGGSGGGGGGGGGADAGGEADARDSGGDGSSPASSGGAGAGGSTSPTGTGGAAGAPQTGDLPSCSPCGATAACAPALECGRPPGGSLAGFCVDPFETTECCLGAGARVACFVVDGSRRQERECPATKPAALAPCGQQRRCLYGGKPFETPCECRDGAWQCHECPADRPAGGCPGGAVGQLCAYGAAQCSCQGAGLTAPGVWRCGACPVAAPAGACGATDVCGYVPNTLCVCSTAGGWGCFGPP